MNPPEPLRTRLTDFRSRVLAARRNLDQTRLGRLEKLCAASPHFASRIADDPALVDWLDGLPERISPEAEWERLGAANGDTIARLRNFRSRLSLAVAFREVNRISRPAATLELLSGAADFCIRTALRIATEKTAERLGVPWDEAGDRPARFCVLALGKLGGRELNFSSDVDLLYLHDGEGTCRVDGNPSSTANAVYFTRLAGLLTRLLDDQTDGGFLYRVDLRLRPDGGSGSLSAPLEALENYYASIGQTWERLMLIKARPVAGDRELGDEFLETLQSFRYPRHAPPSLLADVAALKLRTEKEVVGEDALDRDIKSGRGGIREIEFVVQAMQLLNAGRIPFLQTASTVVALEQLERYQFLDLEETRTLGAAYWKLRRIEHLLQIREEQQAHQLPSDPAELEELAWVTDFADSKAFLTDLERTRASVRAVYDSVFGESRPDEETEIWWEFLAENRPSPQLAEKIAGWLGPAPESVEQLRLFAIGDSQSVVSRESVVRFAHLSRSFGQVLPGLAQPLVALRRIARFAERYGPRHQFFYTCAINPEFFRALALLFDRSEYIHETLCQHPEIFEEVLRPENLRVRKARADFSAEISRAEGDDDFVDWLRLYVRAEQVRHAIGELFGFMTLPEIELALSALAEAVVGKVVSRKPPLGNVLVVALGKLGGRELTLGSDLDLMLVEESGNGNDTEVAARELQSTLAGTGPHDCIYKTDLRLRPHGEAGPFVTTLDALRAYHDGGGAQTWEKQLLTRARVLTGPRAFAAKFEEWRTRLIYTAPIDAAEAAEIWSMRDRLARERAPTPLPERDYKSGPGGILDVEFLAQMLQLAHGHANPDMRAQNTAAAIQAANRAGLLEEAQLKTIADGHAHLKAIESCLRRDTNAPISRMPGAEEAREILAKWLGFGALEPFWTIYNDRRTTLRKTVLDVLARNRLLPGT